MAAEIDEQERFHEENRKRLAELGIMGICYPKEYSDAGHSYIAIIEELEKIKEIYEGTSEVQRMVISSWMGIK